jgi:hypothetical protein
MASSINKREEFLKSQSRGERDISRLQSTQVNKIIADMKLLVELDPEDAARLTDTINEGMWSDAQKDAMLTALSECLCHVDDGTTSKAQNRKQQKSHYPEKLLTEGDIADMVAHAGNESHVCATVSTRAWLVGITCPSEQLKKRLGAIAHVLGGLGLDASVHQKKRVQDKIRMLIKARDARDTHPFPHLQTFPDDPVDLGSDRFQYAGYADSAPYKATPALTADIDSFLMDAKVRKTARVLDVPCGRTPSPGVDGGIADVIAQGFRQMAMQNMAMLQMMRQPGSSSSDGGPPALDSPLFRMSHLQLGDGESDESSIARMSQPRTPVLHDTVLARSATMSTTSTSSHAPLSCSPAAQPASANCAQLAVDDRSDGPIVGGAIDQGLANLDAMERSQIANAKANIAGKAPADTHKKADKDAKGVKPNTKAKATGPVLKRPASSLVINGAKAPSMPTFGDGLTSIIWKEAKIMPNNPKMSWRIWLDPEEKAKEKVIGWKGDKAKSWNEVVKYIRDNA